MVFIKTSYIIENIQKEKILYMSRDLLNILTEEEKNLIIDLYLKNTSIREIANITGRNRKALATMLEKLNIKTTFGNHYRKYFFDFDFFEKIDNELKAYWLGYLYADGCVLPINKYGEQDFQLTAAEQDKEIIEKYKIDLNSTYPIRYDMGQHLKDGKTQIQVIMKMRSQKTVDDLKRLGCVEKKSLILDFPSFDQVPESLMNHFIRGYFDGDGCIYINEKSKVYTIQIVGTENFIKKLKEYLQIGSLYQDKRRINSWYLNIGGRNQVIKMYHYMYDNATRFLQRKYNKFQLIP